MRCLTLTDSAAYIITVFIFSCLFLCLIWGRDILDYRNMKREFNRQYYKQYVNVLGEYFYQPVTPNGYIKYEDGWSSIEDSSKNKYLLSSRRKAKKESKKYCIENFRLIDLEEL